MYTYGDFHGGSVVKNLPTYTRDLNSTFRLRKSSGEGNGSLLQYSCLGNPMDRGAWQAIVNGVTKE